MLLFLIDAEDRCGVNESGRGEEFIITPVEANGGVDMTSLGLGDLFAVVAPVLDTVTLIPLVVVVVVVVVPLDCWDSEGESPEDPWPNRLCLGTPLSLLPPPFIWIEW